MLPQNGSKLQSLYIANNQLATLNASFFLGQGQLQTLYLYSNKLSGFPDGTFTPLTSLTTLWLANNLLVSLPQCAFCNNSALTTLSLGWQDPAWPSGQQGNQLTWLPTPMLPQNGSKLQYLYIANNKLTTLNSTIFLGQANLQSILLFNNKLSFLPLSVFTNLTALKILSLNTNSFSTLFHNQFDAITTLTSLDLSTNNLKYIPACLLCRPSLSVNMLSSVLLPSVCSVSASIGSMNISTCFDPSLYACSPCPMCLCANTTLSLINVACGPSKSGSYCYGGSSFPCTAGSYCPPGSTNATKCPPGTFSNITLASNCTLCPVGTFNSAVGSVSCQRCPGGHYCPAGTSSWARLNCGRGNYCPDGTGAPTPCPYQVPLSGGWGALQVQGPAFLSETAHCLNHCFWNFTSGDGMLSKC